MKRPSRGERESVDTIRKKALLRTPWRARRSRTTIILLRTDGRAVFKIFFELSGLAYLDVGAFSPGSELTNFIN